MASVVQDNYDRGPKDHINLRISHSGSKAQYRGYTRNDAM